MTHRQGLGGCKGRDASCLGTGQAPYDLLLPPLSSAPPTIWGSNETSEVAVMEGHPVWFLCEARGVPMPDITWFKDGDPLVPSAEVVYTRGGRQLQLERAQGSDAGTYSCKASNAVGVVEKTTRLEVYGERPGGAAGARVSWGERGKHPAPRWPLSGSKGGKGSGQRPKMMRLKSYPGEKGHLIQPPLAKAETKTRRRVCLGAQGEPSGEARSPLMV